jgi:hypothetical protein
MSYHATKNMAHAGPYETYLRLQVTYCWPGMKNDIKTALSYCSVCQRVETAAVSLRAPSQPIVTNSILERVHTDLIGPMANPHGYTYVLVITGAFSLWTEATPLTNKRSEIVSWALSATWICRYRWMNILHGDNGTEFVNQSHE